MFKILKGHLWQQEGSLYGTARYRLYLTTEQKKTQVSRPACVIRCASAPGRSFLRVCSCVTMTQWLSHAADGYTHTHTLTHISCLSPSVLCYASPSVMAAFERHCCITRVFCSILVQCFLSWCCPQEALLHNHRSPSEVFAVRQTQVMFLATHSAHITSAHTYESRFI